MIKGLPDLKSDVVDIVKVKPNTDPTKTQGIRVRALLTDILDTVQNLVEGLGSSVSSVQGSYTTQNNQVVGLQDAVTKLQTLTSTYNQLAKKTDIPTIDLTPYQLIASAFDGTWNNLKGKPSLPDFAQFVLKTDKIPYASILNPPTLFSGAYGDLTGKPTIITDYTQLSNKPSMSKLLWNQTTPFVYTNTVIESNVLSIGNGSLDIAANSTIYTGFRLTGRGLFSTQTVVSPTLTIKLYLGNTIIGTGSISSFLIGANNRPLSFYVDILVDGTNSIYTQGSMTYFGAATDILSAAPITNNGISSSVNLAVANTLKMTLTWSVANTSNIIQMKIINLEKLN